MSPAVSPASGSGGSRSLSMLLLVCVLLAATFQIRAYDFFWHLVSGHWILDTLSIPRVDPFRFTSIEQSWIDHEWLFQVLVAGLDRLGGPVLLTVIRGAIAAGVAGLLWWTMVRFGLARSTAGALSFLALVLARRRFTLRPELASLLGLVILLAALRRVTGRRRLLVVVGLISLTVVWANCHPGALLAPAVAFLFLLGCRLDSSSPRPSTRLLFGLPAILATALLATPNGWHLFLVRSRIDASLEGLAAINPEWEPIWRSPQPVVLGVVAALLAATLWSLRVRVPLPAGSLLVALALAALTASAVRHQGLFFLASSLAVGEFFARWRETPWIAPKRRAPVIAAIGLLGVAWCLFPPTRGPLRSGDRPRFGLGIEESRFPARAVDTLQESWSDLGPLYNEVRFGGYLLWRVYPERRIFIDGRNEVHPALLREVTESWREQARWRRLLERYAIDGALLHYSADRIVVVPPGESPDSAAPLEASRSSLLFPRDEFALVYWDDVAMLFVRRTAERAARVAAVEYGHLDPEDPAGTVDRAARDTAFLEAALDEARRKVEEDPACRRAAALLQGLTRIAAPRQVG